GDWLPEMGPLRFNRLLFDGMAGRYLLVDPRVDGVRRHFGKDAALVYESEQVRLYENLRSLPRARFVPTIRLAARRDILPLLATGRVDQREAALVEQLPASGFTGSTARGSASVAFTVDDAERVVLQADSDEPGFLLLADQCYPGRTATVNGVPSPILCA